MLYTRPPIGFAPAMISPMSACGTNIYTLGASTPASGAWPTNNQAFFFPVNLPWPTRIERWWVANGGTASGAWSVAVYDESAVRLATSGAVTQTGTNVIQFSTVNLPVVLPPGVYYIGMSASTTALTVFRHTLTSVSSAELSGMLSQATAHPCPDPATFAATASNIMPYFGLSTVTGP